MLYLGIRKLRKTVKIKIKVMNTELRIKELDEKNGKLEDQISELRQETRTELLCCYQLVDYKLIYRDDRIR